MRADTLFPSSLFNDTWTAEEAEFVSSLQGPIMVIGASGFIGAKLFFSLSARRNDVFAASRFPERSWRLSQADPKKLISLDITDFARVKNKLSELRPKTVFNLSAFGAYERQKDPQAIHQVNYFGNLNLITVLLEQGCAAYIQAGTSSEYGLNCAGPGEGDALIPNSDYAVSKVAASYLVQYYGKFHQFPAVNLRLYSIYGPWEERDRLIPTLISRALQGKFPAFADRNISRDFVYIDDCTHAMVKAALTADQGERGLSVNVATGVKTSLEQIAGISKQVFKIVDEPQFGKMANRKWDLSNWFGDPTLASQKLKWKARTPLDEGLKLTADWEQVASRSIRFWVPPKKTKKVSAIIACYRDNQAIPVMYERLTRVFEKIQIDYEIIFVNDCSPADDEQVILGLCRKDPHVIGISHSRNFGSQSAFVSGMEVSTGDAVVLLDGDLQDTPEVIEEFYKKWEQGLDIVYGKRVKRQAPFHMQILYKVFYRIFKQMVDFDIPVDAGDFSLIDRKVVNHLLQFPEKDLFLRGLRAWVGFKQEGVPYVRPERMFGRTTNNFLKNIWWAKKAIFSYSIKPLEYIQRTGTFIFFVSVVLSIFYGLHYFLNPQHGPRGITTIVLLVLGLGGIQIMSLSILGDYIGKILDEVKNRPRFIRSKLYTGGEIYQGDEQIHGFLSRNRRTRA